MTRTPPKSLPASSLLLLLASLTAVAANAGTGPAAGELQPFRIDETFGCESRDPDLAALPGGGFAAVWVSEARRVVLRRFDAGHEPVGSETVVNDEPPAADGAIGDVAVAADPDGRLAVVWTDNRAGLRGRLFDAAGAPATEVLSLAAGGLDPELDLAALPDRSFVVVWQRGTALETLRFDGWGGPLGSFQVARTPGGNESVRQPSVAVLGEDRLVIAWNHRMVGFPFPFTLVATGIFALDGRLLSEPGPGVNGDRPALAVRPTGGFLRVWRRSGSIVARGFDPQGNPLGPEIPLRPLAEVVLTGPDLALLPDGSAHVVWEERSDAVPVPGVPPPGRIVLRRLSAEGRTQGPIETLGFGPGTAGSDGAPRTVTLAGGDTLVAARHLLPHIPVTVPCSFVAAILARTVPRASLVVADRFRVTVEWHDASSGDRGMGFPGPRTADAGSFWFFEPDNLELIVKIVDGRTFNGHFWFFYGALTHVGYQITVTDLVTGKKRRYENPPGRLASFADTRAFREPDTLPSSPPGVRAGSHRIGEAAGGGAPPGVLFLSAEPSAQIDSSAGPCSRLELPVVPRPGLCLADRRFEVEVQWSDPRNDLAGAGRPIEVNDVTGAFWFFRPSNVELVVKVLDGRPVNGRFWVLYGSLTDVAFTLKVRHSETLDQVVFDNAPFEMSSGADTSSLVPPECNCPLVPPQPVCGFDGVTYPDACHAACVGWVGVAHTGVCEAGEGN